MPPLNCDDPIAGRPVIKQSQPLSRSSSETIEHFFLPITSAAQDSLRGPDRKCWRWIVHCECERQLSRLENEKQLVKSGCRYRALWSKIWVAAWINLSRRRQVLREMDNCKELYGMIEEWIRGGCDEKATGRLLGIQGRAEKQTKQTNQAEVAGILRSRDNELSHRQTASTEHSSWSRGQSAWV